MSTVNDFLTSESLMTFGGTTLAAIVVSNTYRALLKKDPRIIAFIISVGSCFFIAYQTENNVMGYFIALINGCLVFCSAFGLNNQIVKPPAQEGNGQQTVRRQKTRSVVKSFFSNW